MTQETIQKTFDSFIAWLKSKKKNVKVEKIVCDRTKFTHGIRVISHDCGVIVLGYGNNFEEAMEDLLEDAMIDYEFEEINKCNSIEELALRLAVLGFDMSFKDI